MLGTLPALRGGILWWHAWVASSMPLVGSAPPCGGQVPTWGPGPCFFTWWRRALLTASLERVLPVYHLLVTGMLVWCVGTCPHAAHRQSFVDGLITWIAHPPHLRVCCIIVPLAVATLPTQPYNVASCTSSNRVLLAVRLAGTSVSLALFLRCSTHAQSTPACWQ